MKPELKMTGGILAIGFAPFAMQLAMSFVNVFQNHALDAYGGDAAVSAMGIAFSVMIMAFMPLMGLNQGAQPIIGYNYGAKKYDRVRHTFILALIAATVFISACFLLIQFFPKIFISIFNSEEGPIMSTGVYCLRVSTTLFPALGFQVLSANYFQAIGKPLQGTILSLSRQLLLYLPLLLFLSRAFGLRGIFFAMPAADLGAILITAYFMLKELRRLGRLIRDEKQQG
jgi:Na+-driven multidrug efflux pump